MSNEAEIINQLKALENEKPTSEDQVTNPDAV